MEQNDPNKKQMKMMERNALITFLSCASLVFGTGLTYCFWTGNMFAFYLLLGIISFLAVFLSFIFKKK